MKFTIYIVTGILSLVWLYAFFNKLLNINSFKKGMQSEPLPPAVKRILTWLLPPIELATSLLLVFEHTRLAGFYLSFLLLLAFAVYIAGAVLDFYDQSPSVLGILFRKIRWERHLWINLLLTILALIGIFLNRHVTK